MGNMVFGYARVSTQDQELARQIDALGKYGVDEIFTEKMTGARANRPELNRLKDKVRTGDTVVIESLSRLGRSTKDLLSLIEDWNHQGVKLVSLKESIDTTTPKASPSRRGGMIDIGSDCGLYQIFDGNHVVAGWRYDLTLEDVEEWISEHDRDNEWMYAGGDWE